MDQLVFTIAEFCTTHRVSRTALYEEMKRGAGPRHFKIGTKVLITTEAAAAWRAEREAAAQKQTVEAA